MHDKPEKRSQKRTNVRIQRREETRQDMRM
jgi:hypothetical protein